MKNAIIATYLAALDDCYEATIQPQSWSWFANACELLAAQIKYLQAASPENSTDLQGLRLRFEGYHKWFRQQC